MTRIKNSRDNHPKSKESAFLGDEGLQAQPEEQQTYGISSMATEMAKSGALLTLHAVSYCADTLIKGTDKVVDELKSNVALLGAPKWLLPGMATLPHISNWVEPAVSAVLGNAAPAIIIASEVASSDPTGLRAVFKSYSYFKTYLICTRAAADIVADTIETGDFKEAAVSKAKEIGISYIPSHVKNYFSSKQSAESLER